MLLTRAFVTPCSLFLLHAFLMALRRPGGSGMGEVTKTAKVKDEGGSKEEGGGESKRTG